jgi:imidazolonepropionase-like amidohydrolase
MTVLVDAAGTIEQVAPAAEVSVPAGYRRIDVAGEYVRPGLINAHARTMILTWYDGWRK